MVTLARCVLGLSCSREITSALGLVLEACGCCILGYLLDLRDSSQAGVWLSRRRLGFVNTQVFYSFTLLPVGVRCLCESAGELRVMMAVGVNCRESS